VVGVEPEAGDDATRSFHSGTLCRVDNPDTIADGARTESLGEVTFPIVRGCVDDMVTVTDAELIATMRLVLERLKLVVEPTGVLAAAALLGGKVGPVAGRIGVILSGGNVDPARLGEWLAG
jgi:threonine dehydratase